MMMVSATHVDRLAAMKKGFESRVKGFPEFSYELFVVVLVMQGTRRRQSCYWRPALYLKTVSFLNVLTVLFLKSPTPYRVNNCFERAASGCDCDWNLGTNCTPLPYSRSRATGDLSAAMAHT